MMMSQLPSLLETPSYDWDNLTCQSQKDFCQKVEICFHFVKIYYQYLKILIKSTGIQCSKKITSENRGRYFFIGAVFQNLMNLTYLVIVGCT